MTENYEIENVPTRQMEDIMKMHAATDWSIIREGKECVIFDRSTLERVAIENIHSLNEKYAFVFPEVLLMECAKAKNPKVVENIEGIETFLIISIRDKLMIDSDFVPCPPHDIMKKDLGVSMLRELEEDSNLVYFIPYTKAERTELINWAKNGSADDYYNYFEDFAQMFNGETPATLKDVVEDIHLRGFIGGHKLVPKDQIKEYIKKYSKVLKKEYGFNPLYGNQLNDVIGVARMILERTPIIEIIENLSKVFEFDPSWPKRQIEMRPNWPHPDDFAKYSYYFYVITMCSVFCGFMMEKKYLRDWQYIYHLPFCSFITSDKRFFKNLREAMKIIGTDRNLGINISDRIHIWGEDNIIEPR